MTHQDRRPIAEIKKSDKFKLKAFELERTQMINDETVKNYQKALMENEKLQKKIEIIQKEFYTLQLQNDKRFLS